MERDVLIDKGSYFTVTVLSLMLLVSYITLGFTIALSTETELLFVSSDRHVLPDIFDTLARNSSPATPNRSNQQSDAGAWEVAEEVCGQSTTDIRSVTTRQAFVVHYYIVHPSLRLFFQLSVRV
ncbi:hypothetical protein J6590_074510 [Homalodisca vitripennis]|nr:hypothetical protein J6590_074510 [Homalodisca vitripennis]